MPRQENGSGLKDTGLNWHRKSLIVLSEREIRNLLASNVEDITTDSITQDITIQLLQDETCGLTQIIVTSNAPLVTPILAEIFRTIKEDLLKTC